MRNNQFPGRSVVIATRAMVATSQPMATEAALRVLREGGNALDAAICAAAVLGVVEPYSTGIGGDCFLLYHEAASGRLHALNGSGWAPAAATPEAYRARGAHGAVPEHGILSVTVPGAVDAWWTAHRTLGATDFARLIAPAIEFAEQGYAVTPVIAAHWRETESLLRATPQAARAFLVDGEAPRAGTVHRQPDLARTLRAIAERGRDGFYTGRVAEEIVRFSDTRGGLLALGDLADFESEWVTPISSDYRGHRVFEIPPNGQGITVLMALNILACSNVETLERLGAGHLHLLAEVFGLAMAERDRFVADQRGAEVPVEALLSPQFAASQWARFDPRRAQPQPVASALPEHRDTVYLSVVDEQRNACSFINSTFASWGSGLVAGDTGVALQNRGSGFVLVPGHRNCIAPRKRPLHTIIPAMVYRDQRPVMSFGVMGGHYQAMGQTYFLSNWLDFGLDIQQALDAPRFMLRHGELQVEQGIEASVRSGLTALGHRVRDASAALGGGQAVLIDWHNGTLHGASDPRKDGCALGY